MRNLILPVFVSVAFSSSAFAQARVIITEIMYNPASTEKQNESEWIEIANVGNEPIEIKDWSLRIAEKKTKWGTFNCTLAPGGVAVLVNAAAVNDEQFRAAWDATDDTGSESQKLDYQVIPVKWGALSNSPSAENPLQLLNDKSEMVCEVKFGEGWPKIKGGPSAYLTDVTATTVSDAKLWRASEAAKDGARTNKVTTVFDKEDVGSPGYVNGLTAGGSAPTPTAPPDAPKPKADDAIDY